MKLSKKTKAAIESIFWMVLLGLGPQVILQLESGKAIWELDPKALTTGVVLTVIRFIMNYKNKDDPRYGPNETKKEGA
jgi:hypothetical protein